MSYRIYLWRCPKCCSLYAMPEPGEYVAGSDGNGGWRAYGIEKLYHCSHHDAPVALEYEFELERV